MSSNFTRILFFVFVAFNINASLLTLLNKSSTKTGALFSQSEQGQESGNALCDLAAGLGGVKDWNCTNNVPSVGGGNICKGLYYSSYWPGVTCDSSGNIWFITLTKTLTHGTISSSLGKLSSLQFLQFYDVSIHGTIPSTIGYLKSLISLGIIATSLTGTIPSSIGLMSSLSIFSLFGNSLSGTIPTSIGLLTQLNFMTVGLSYLTGSIPSSIGLMSSLNSMFIDFNNLTGTIPSTIGLLKAAFLFLAYNKLTGTIPTSIGLITSLSALSLQSNRLSGSIPTTIRYLTKVYAIYLNSNKLTRTIPSSIGYFSSLLKMDLSYNSLSSTIPSSFGSLTTLINMTLTSNRLTGTVPTQLCSLTNLRYLAIYNQNSLDCSSTCSIIKYRSDIKYYGSGQLSTPTAKPSMRPSQPTVLPTLKSLRPTDHSTVAPTFRPTAKPSRPSLSPTANPTRPTTLPTMVPSQPSLTPTVLPTSIPSVTPSLSPIQGAVTFLNFNTSVKLSFLSTSALTISSATQDSLHRQLAITTTPTSSDTVSLLSYVVYEILGLSTYSSVNTLLIADGLLLFYNVTFEINIFAESLKYTSKTVSQLYDACLIKLSDSLTKGTFVSNVKTEAIKRNLTGFSNMKTASSFSFSKAYISYTATTHPTLLPTCAPLNPTAKKPSHLTAQQKIIIGVVVSVSGFFLLLLCIYFYFYYCRQVTKKSPKNPDIRIESDPQNLHEI